MTLPQTNGSLELSKKYVLENYGRVDLVFSRGEGSLIFDEAGRRYLDLFAGFGAGGIAGHCHPEITRAIQEQAGKLLSHGNLFTNSVQAKLAEKLIAKSFPGKVFFCHSGAEANEAALKLARKAAGLGRHKIISFDNCFHGRTMGALSLTPWVFQEGFEPMLEGNMRLPYGDLAELEKAIDAETCAIFVEPIQSEGGMYPAKPEFMLGIRELCNRHKLLMICDEVWSAPARTGAWFAYQHYDVCPDVITCAKALGGGLPVAACIIAEQWTTVLGPGSHGCTLGGNPLCAAAALRALELVEELGLCKRAQDLGDTIVDKLQSAKIAAIKEIRGKGLMLGIELKAEFSPASIVQKCRDKGVLIGLAKNNVIRLAPALTISEALLTEGLDVVKNALSQ